MALGLAANAAYIKKYVKSTLPTMYLKECDSSGTALTTGDGTVWVVAGITKGTKLQPNVSEEKQKDDRNVTVSNVTVVEDWTIDTTLMQRDANSRQITMNADGKYYQVVLAGAAVGSLQEVWAFAPCQISPGFTYSPGDLGQIENIKITTISNTTTISITVPTQVGTGTVTVAPGKMVGTADITPA